jgi:hypothetical protein
MVTMSGVLMVVGVVLEAAGLGITGWGISQTWRSSGTTERFAGPLIEGAERVRHRAEGMARRVLRRPAPAITVPVSTARMTLWANTVAAGVVGFPPLDSELSTAEAVAELDDRVRKVLEIVAANRTADLDRLSDVFKQGQQTALDVARVRADLEDAELRLSVEGLRIEGAGLALVAFGLLLQMVGSLVSALA